jgi:hypothetical protein
MEKNMLYKVENSILILIFEWRDLFFKKNINVAFLPIYKRHINLKRCNFKVLFDTKLQKDASIK